MAEEDYFGGKTSYFGGAGEYAPEFSTNAAPPIDYSNINFGVPGQAGVSYLPDQFQLPTGGAPEPFAVRVPSRSAADVINSSFSPYGIQPGGGFLRTAATAAGGPQAAIPAGAEPGAGIGDAFERMAEKVGANIPAQDPNALQRLDQYFKANPMLAKLLGGGLTAGLGAIMGARGQAAAGRLQKDIGKLGATQRQQGQALVAAAQRGELTAPQQQQLEAFRAQQAQALSSRGITGGTAAQQLDAQIENMRQQLLQQNLQTGLALLQVGDQYTQQAITAGYNASQNAQNTAANFYNQALRTFGGQSNQSPVVITRDSTSIPAPTPIAPPQG